MTDKRAALWLLKTTGKYRGYIGILLLLQAIISGGAVCYALIMKTMIDYAVEQNRKGFFLWLFIFAMLIFILHMLRMVLRQLEEAARSGMENNFKKVLFEQLLRKDYGQVSAVHSEDWMNRITSDTIVCGSGMTEIVPGFTGMLIRMVGALLMIFLIQPRLAYIMIPVGIIFMGITLVLRRYLKVLHKAVQEKDGEVRVYLQERISSMLVLRTFGVEKQALEGAKKRLAGHKGARMKKAFISNLCNTGFSLAINGMYLLGIGYCGYGILNGVVSYGTLTAIIQLVGQLQTPLSGISGYIPRFYAMLASSERLMEIEEFKDVQTIQVKTMEETRMLYDKSIETINISKVSFEYIKENDRCPVLQEMSLSVDKGDYAAITGVSGCGKSTLLKLLMGIYEPKMGAVEVLLKDGRKMPVRELRRLFAYVPQGNYLMSGTIREVITFGREQQEKDGISIENAIGLACGEFIFDLPEGLDTMLGEKGAGLSEGQMQRIAIARALYANAPVLILDEGTSALDADTEERLLRNLKQLTDKTVLIVTHRMEALKICNKKFDFSDKDGFING